MKNKYTSGATNSIRFCAKALFIVFGMMLWMPHALRAQEFQLSVPENYNGTYCMDQDVINLDFSDWLNRAIATDFEGCYVVLHIDSSGPPPACGGTAEVTWTATSTCETEPLVLTSIFYIPDALPVTVIGPANVDATSCIYANQAALDAAFATWIAAFAVTEDGCGVTLPDLSAHTAPVLCTGGEVEVIFAVEDLCTNASITRTFKIAAPSVVTVIGPANVDATSCTYANQAALDAAFATWIAAFAVTEDGCGVTPPDLSAYTAPVLCTGGEVEVTYAISDLCSTASITRTFKITAPQAVVLNVPQSLTYTGCYTNAEIQGFYNTWLGSATATGGCYLNLTHNAPLIAPDNCSGEIVVDWTLTSSCFTPQTGTSVFTVVNNPVNVLLNLPENTNIPNGSTQDQIDTQFNNWLSTFSYEGGCNPVLTRNNPGPPSACGETAEVTWTVTSDCEGIVSGSSTFSVAYTIMLYDNIVSEENPHAPLINYYDDRGTAFFTNGTSGSANNPAAWSSASWTWCLRDGKDIGNPPKAVDNAKNQLYLQISAGDFIRVDRLSYQNNITIVVCGYLEIGDFIVEDGGAYLNNINIVICEGGFLKATKLDLKNSVSIYNYGTLQAGSITGQASNSKKCIQGSGNFQDLHGNAIIDHDLENDEWLYNGAYLSGSWTFGVNCGDIGKNVPLPIELLSFDYSVHSDYIEIKWITAAEINNDFFTIERSTNIRTWEIIGYMHGAGTTSEMRHYSLNDYNPVNGLSYYRLKQTDFDGQFEYFGPISVSHAEKQNELNFRIVKNQQQWTIYLMGEEECNIEIYSLTGQKLYSGNITGELAFPAPLHPVIIRVINGNMQHASRVMMQN